MLSKVLKFVRVLRLNLAWAAHSPRAQLLLLMHQPPDATIAGDRRIFFKKTYPKQTNKKKKVLLLCNRKENPWRQKSREFVIILREENGLNFHLVTEWQWPISLQIRTVSLNLALTQDAMRSDLLIKLGLPLWP